MEPLRASVYDLSAAGNLTITFSRPIIVPPIRVHQTADLKADASEQSQQTIPTDRKLEERGNVSEEYDSTGAAYDDFSFEIDEVVDLKVESSFYDAGSDEIHVESYTLTALNEDKMDI